MDEHSPLVWTGQPVWDGMIDALLLAAVLSALWSLFM